MKIYTIIFILILLLCSGNYFFYTQWSNEKDKKESYIQAYNSHIDSLRTWSDKLNRIHNETIVIEAANKKILKDITQKDSDFEFIKDKLNKIIVAQSFGTKTEYHFHSQMKDTIINDTVHRTTHYKDNWLTFNQIIKNDTSYVDWITKDTIRTNIYWSRKKWILGLRIGRKEYNQEIIHSNPNMKITYNKSIILQRK